MRKILAILHLIVLVFVATPAFANFIVGNASKYNLHISCGRYNFAVPRGAKPAVIPYNLKQRKYNITFKYFNLTDNRPIFKGVILGNVACSNDIKSCVGTISLRKKSFAEFIEVYKQNSAGDVNIVFDDLPTSIYKVEPVE